MSTTAAADVLTNVLANGYIYVYSAMVNNNCGISNFPCSLSLLRVLVLPPAAELLERQHA